MNKIVANTETKSFHPKESTICVLMYVSVCVVVGGVICRVKQLLKIKKKILATMQDGMCLNAFIGSERERERERKREV